MPSHSGEKSEPLRGEIRAIVDEGDSPQGVKGELQSGVTGHVRRVVAD
ncbi:hypothetical protein [Halorussus salinisoli]|nr:hypothetical protein [Halorussus salinisoli]